MAIVGSILQLQGRALAGLVLVSAVAVSTVSGQSVWSVGGSATGNLVVGAGGSDFLDSGFGLDITVARNLTRHVALRADGVLIRLAPSSSGTSPGSNTVVALGLGPEASMSLSAVSLYARLLVGGAVNLRGGAGSTGSGGPTWAGVLGGGLGLRVAVSRSVALDLGGDVLKLGELTFVGSAASSFRFVEDPAVLRVRVGFRVGVG